jgi:hypothetical protein
VSQIEQTNNEAAPETGPPTALAAPIPGALYKENRKGNIFVALGTIQHDERDSSLGCLHRAYHHGEIHDDLPLYVNITENKTGIHACLKNPDLHLVVFRPQQVSSSWMYMTHEEFSSAFTRIEVDPLAITAELPRHEPKEVEKHLQ